MISPARAERLRPLLDAFRDPRAHAARLARDPLEFPHRYRDPRDVEAVALISCALAYGRVDLFKPKIAGLLANLGPSPARTLSALSVQQARELLQGFVYRFNVASDVAVLLLGIGRTLGEFGSLEEAFLRPADHSWRERIAAFVTTIRAQAPERQIVAALGATRGVNHLLPGANQGAAKRLNLYLRWLVRRSDGIDLGVWSRVAPSQLIMPLDTHIARLAGWLGLTTRRTMGWAMAEDITASLRLLDPEDPVKYDFALCHYGMSGACPIIPVPSNCRACPLRSACRHGAKRR